VAQEILRALVVGRRKAPAGKGHFRVMVVFTAPPVSSSSNQRWVIVLVWV
jgi:hypothetical protein